MLRTALLLLIASQLFSSCCYRRPTSAQSDRLETRRPLVPVIECYECGDLTNTTEFFLLTEAKGTSNRWNVGAEAGYNFTNFRVFTDAGTRWWPNGNLTWANREQIGVVPFNPNWQFHPEIGTGLHQRYFRDQSIQTPTINDPTYRKSPELYWQTFAGVRYSIKYSNVLTGFRVYRLQEFGTSRIDWNVGFQLSFRL